ncbi:FAD:protein FMN transferase [Fulvivirga sedimenti]|uniref:FAD:protein FMN transferase n=1 Tax=Fulvivirga sedimenti TaxID=2879465 RepID=A0A9X1HVQ3_9BACT|nr:FAD:protein FMN transferase [Fulvivirga sedimenti]MCA6078235.1 FAD:protein FMN transferase [Fulvivirga sedimenti]
MDLRFKNILYTLILVGAVVIVYLWRNSGEPVLVTFTGTTMGPIRYSVKYYDEKERNFKTEVDSILIAFNQSLNTYIPDSEISQFNLDSVWNFKSEYFFPVLELSDRIYNETNGAYDPTVMPLVNIWGFGPGEQQFPDSSAIDSIKTFIGFERISYDKNQVAKSDRRVQLDFSASAKGYGVDVVVDFLIDQGINNCFVEIGGEVRVVGSNIENDMPWRIGIIDPNSTEGSVRQFAVIELENRAIATSGNYFNYRVVDGRKFSHTIDPSSGYPVVHPLLSASVTAQTCMEADALATAFMVMGHEKAIKYLNEHPEIGAFLIFSTPSGELSTYGTVGLNVKMSGQ